MHALNIVALPYPDVNSMFFSIFFVYMALYL